MAPEQFVDAAHVGPPADVFSLGKILAEILTGQRPNPGRPTLTQIPEAYRSFVQRSCADDPDDRYKDARDALEAFDLLIPGATTRIDISGETIESLLEKWESVPEGEDEEEVRRVLAYLLANTDEEELYYRALPRFPRLLVQQMIEMNVADFRRVLEAYDRHIEGSLPFDYVDVVADFYVHVFEQTDDAAIRRLVLERLVYLGPSHNRWHVGGVLARILPEIGDEATAEIAAEVLRESPRRADWFFHYIGGLEAVASPIQDVIGEMKERAASED
ncbi:MAG: hypothetical protein M3N16_00360 [Actinomycetota bacterium]|nr:hypothetical protein [Actinomycetota bacterium]